MVEGFETTCFVIPSASEESFPKLFIIGGVRKLVNHLVVRYVFFTDRAGYP
jgi:hypothetical protein